MTWVIVPAAGRGRRFDADLPKQYWPIDQCCVLEHTLARLLAHPDIAGVVLALASDDTRFAALPCATDARIRRVDGGAERADSVRAALQALPAHVADDDAVLVHDAARPCLSSELLSRLLAYQHETSGALLALPVVDTLKCTAADGDTPRASTTVDRGRYWRAQTPQMFPRGLLQRALARAAAEGIVVTDESMAVERLGHTPRLIEGSADNLKLTHPEDLPVIKAWLARHPLGQGKEQERAGCV